MHLAKLAVLAVLISGCASAATRDRPTTAATSQDPTEREVCEVTRVTGTNVTRTVCRTEYERTLERNGAQEWMRNGTSATADGVSLKPAGP